MSAGSPQYGIIDNLTYTFEGANTVKEIEDSADPYRGFLGTSAEYVSTYGRLDNDLGVKAASVTEYNFLNQPVNIKRGNKQNYKHAYDAYGNMHKQTTYDQNDNPHVREYHDGIEYYDGKIQAVYHAEGRFVYEREADGSLKRNYNEYMIKDHTSTGSVHAWEISGCALLI